MKKLKSVTIPQFLGIVILLLASLRLSHSTEQDEHETNGNGSQTIQTTDQLKLSLLTNYDVKTPPKEDGRGIKVGVGMTLNYFTMEEAEHIFVANAWVRMTWKDNRLAFDASHTNGTYLRFGNGEIWQPDLTLYNNAFPTEIDHYGDTHILLKPDGTVLWLPPARLAAHCTLNMIRWPYDVHTCELKLGSWTHHGEEVDLYHTAGRDSNDTSDNPENMIDHFNFVKNSQWQLLKTKTARNAIIYDCCPEPYIDLTFSFTFQRDSPSYVISIVLPIILISIVNMLTFLLPPSSGEKVLLGAINFFILSMFLLYFQAKLPPLGDHLPLLVLLYGCNLVLVSISLTITVLIINLTRTRRVSSPPQCLRILCNIHFATMLGLGHLTPFVSQTHSRFEDGVEMQSPIGSSSSSNSHGRGRRHIDLNGDIKDSDRTNLVVNDVEESPFYVTSADWILLACMIDRVTFIAYAIVNGILLGICLG